TIFARYLELGSVRALAQDLDRRAIRSKPRQLSNGRTLGGGRFGVGALAYLLKNRFYIGEVVYRGEVHGGEQAPIVDRALFAAAAAQPAGHATRPRARRRGSATLRARRPFDQHGHPLSPNHAHYGRPPHPHYP